RAADSAADRDAHVLGCLRPLPRSEHEIVSLDEVDPDPGEVGKPLMEDGDRLGEHRVGLALAVDEPIDGLEGAAMLVGGRAHRATGSSRSAPSKTATRSR